MKIFISKLDAAKRQLETSLRIFFNNSDFVSIHTLTHASYEILTQLCASRGIENIINEGIKKFIREDKREELKIKLNEAKNFFKHSGRDSDKNIEFNPEINPILLWDSCRLYKILTTEHTPVMSVFHVWFVLKNKEIILDEKLKETLNTFNYSNYLDIENKKHFLEIMLPIAEKNIVLTQTD